MSDGLDPEVRDLVMTAIGVLRKSSMETESLAGRAPDDFFERELTSASDDLDDAADYITDELELTEERIEQGVESMQLEAFGDD